MSEVSTSTPCADCGALVFPDANFCQNCGRRLAPSGKREWVSATKEFVVDTLESAADTAKEVMQSPKSKKVAGGAVIGAGVGAVLPIVTVGMGAFLGAAFIGYKFLTKQED